MVNIFCEVIRVAVCLFLSLTLHFDELADGEDFQ